MALQYIVRRLLVEHGEIAHQKQPGNTRRLHPGDQRIHRQHLLHGRSEEHTSELQSLMRISYTVFCLKKTKQRRATKPKTHTRIPKEHSTSHTTSKLSPQP